MLELRRQSPRRMGTFQRQGMTASTSINTACADTDGRQQPERLYSSKASPSTLLRGHPPPPATRKTTQPLLKVADKRGVERFEQINVDRDRLQDRACQGAGCSICVNRHAKNHPLSAIRPDDFDPSYSFRVRRNRRRQQTESLLQKRPALRHTPAPPDIPRPQRTANLTATAAQRKEKTLALDRFRPIRGSERLHAERALTRSSMLELRRK